MKRKLFKGKHAAHSIAIGLFIFLIFGACENQASYPRPKAYFALSYNTPQYDKVAYQFFRIPINKKAQVLSQTPTGLELYYPDLKASLFLNYVSIASVPLDTLMQSMHLKLAEHQKKATAIVALPYEEVSTNKIGVLYEIKGNAASAAQFYVTDKKQNFLNGALYFNIRPHYDSIYPAAQYLIQDLRAIIDEVVWQHNP